MKKLVILLTALLAHPLAAEEAKPPGLILPQAKPVTPSDLPVAKIDLYAHHHVNDAIQQILAGLPPEARSSLILDISEAELAKMPIKGELRLHNTPLRIVLKYLEQASPVGHRFWNNQWHISKERADDVIEVSYTTSKAQLEQLGLLIGPGRTLVTKRGQAWPVQSGSWAATYSTSNLDAVEKFDETKPFAPRETGILQVLAARSYHEEISAALLLMERGHDTLTLDR